MPFEIPGENLCRMGCDRERRAGSSRMGCTVVCRLREAVAGTGGEFTRSMKGDLPAGWVENMQKYVHDCNPIRRRWQPVRVGQKCLNHFADMLQELMGARRTCRPLISNRHQKSVDFTEKIRRGSTSPMACVNLVCHEHHERSYAAWWVYPLRRYFPDVYGICA